MTEDDLVIRPAQPAEYNDVTIVAPMHLRSWKQCYGKFVPKEHLDNQFNAFGLVDEYRHLIDNEGQTMLVAESAGTIVAVAIFGADRSDSSRGKIEALYVVPERRCQRIGTRMLNEVLARLDYGVVVLECATENESGRGFWEARGFRLDGEGRPFPIPGYGDVETVRYVLDNSVAG